MRFKRRTKVLYGGQSQGLLGVGDMSATAWGLQKVATDFSLHHGLFTFDIPQLMWIIEEDDVELTLTSSSTRVTSVGGEAVVKSGTVAGNTAKLESRRHPRYQPNRGHIWSASIFLDNPTSGQVEFGLFQNGDDGAFFRRKPDGNLYAVIVSDSVETYEEQIVIPEEWTSFDISKGNIYDIQMQWRGVGNIYFYIGNPETGMPEIVHVADFSGSSDNVTISNPALPISFKAINIGGNEGQLRVGCTEVSSEGGNAVQQQYVSFTGEKLANGTDIPVLSVQSPDLAPNGKTNTRDSALSRLVVSSDKKIDVTLWTTRDPTALTGASFTSDGSNRTFLQKDTVATVLDTNKAEAVISFEVGPNDPVILENPAPENIELWVIHKDIFIVTATASSATVRATLEFGDEV